MIADCFYAKRQSSGDIGIRVPLRDESQNLTLAGSQFRENLRRRSRLQISKKNA
jgi:hypothetical protein